MKLTNPAKLLISLALPQLAGLLGAVFVTDSLSTWYRTLNTGILVPPEGLFGPTWTILYLLMGVSLYLVWKQWTILPWSRRTKRLALIAFAAQLVLNSLWSVIFFGLRSPELALLEIIMLMLAIALNIVLFWGVSRKAAYLLVPYLLWVCFATYLNFSIVRLN